MNNENKILPVAIVTGSTKGIGRGIAECLARSGFAIVITSRKLADAENLALAIQEQGHTAIGLQFDLDNAESIDTLINSTIQHYGRLDVLVNNALSTSCVPDFQTLDAENINAAFTANITNNLLLTKSAQPHLLKTKGNVINIGSIVVNRPILGMTLYTMVKGAITQMTKSLAAEWAKDGIRVNCINPGFIRSSALEELGLPKEFIDKAYAHCEQFHPLENKIGEAEDVGNMAVYLASPQAKLVTGSIIEIDGGLSVQGISIQPEV